MCALESSRLWRAALLAAPLFSRDVFGQTQSQATATTTATITTSPPAAKITADPFEGWQISGGMSKSFCLSLSFAPATPQLTERSPAIPVSCPNGEVFVTSANFAACCPSASSLPAQCTFATACEGNAVAFKDGETSNCGPLQCRTRKIYQSLQKNAPVLTEPLCLSRTDPSTLFREVPMTAGLVLPLAVVDEFAVAAATTNAPVMFTILDTKDSPTAVGAAPASSTATVAASDPAPPNFAPAVVGSILGTIAVIGLVFLAFWFGRRRGNGGGAGGGKYQRRNSYDSLEALKVKPESPFARENRYDPRALPKPRTPIELTPSRMLRFPEDRFDEKEMYPGPSRLGDSAMER
ncbi:hypothetical protein GGS23DRAFT_420186 [Durotheca rogersii]|uniref:uncharacterized protein n=1 Tax=Durotheca rogersii TaxID=419775 RepID=UPI00221F1DCA|nr:uncharacterized protein GGS23DRAFT_420186 [Durotheca rogersii]KAI5865290.1 hypothetical protein GGS23DRAFT_420186 [Durotheca rogersii]